jgi:putative N-acetylmannosamine-6-phosphate epimerase
MSDIDRLEQKIDSTNDKMDKLVEAMTTFIAFQARAEERHQSTDNRINKLEELVSKLWDMVHKNALIVNGALAVCGIIVGAVAAKYLG